jgi:hypothetical protein
MRGRCWDGVGVVLFGIHFLILRFTCHDIPNIPCNVTLSFHAAYLLC